MRRREGVRVREREKDREKKSACHRGRLVGCVGGKIETLLVGKVH